MGRRSLCPRGLCLFCPRTNQLSQFRDKMAKPWQRIHFAGEHTASASPGMESALESAERVVGEILADKSKVMQ
ncbi:MAG: FAD-dependent oxidoreductase [Hormoscilla sp. SP5CHS1]|nr:FAD-dependent oxidoreductase [Hormoscilla sp. SP12CHS1]MBC6452115.1 FAD-dependent oxidoreductase [Hormoscilla sp. SP5CHS1]